MKIYSIMIDIINMIRKDKIFIYSSHASFYIIISAVPFITLALSLIQKFITISEYDISNTLLPFLPVAAQNAGKTILEEIINKKGNMISISVISLLWNASRGISGIRRGLRNIYNLSNPNIFYEVITSMLLVLPLILLVLLMLVLSLVFTLYLSVILKAIIGVILFTLLFSLSYFLFTKRCIPLKNHLPGGLFASISWILFIRIFSFYIENFSNYSYVYGSLTAVLLISLWVYFSIIIFFSGAVINKILYFKKRTV